MKKKKTQQQQLQQQLQYTKSASFLRLLWLFLLQLEAIPSTGAIHIKIILSEAAEGSCMEEHTYDQVCTQLRNLRFFVCLRKIAKIARSRIFGVHLRLFSVLSPRFAKISKNRQGRRFFAFTNNNGGESLIFFKENN